MEAVNRELTLEEAFARLEEVTRTLEDEGGFPSRSPLPCIRRAWSF
ncbi:MAG: hypothetical protein ACLTQL_10515 [Eisenbergiella sp.]